MADDVNQVFSGDKMIQNPDGSFLSNVIKPIYEILSKEAGKNKGGKASHSRWSNYDDLNECFWSGKCSLELRKQKEKMPLRAAHEAIYFSS
ncbi:hypothetical protein E1A91_A04G187300v1 [Gossypium mustelinum]|uniref:1,3-beta-glucan synthase component FKS1-like domain-containing protein n=1 Tax=Gossypium mustelinum TaxID=34275 RepID=A0A5D2ZSR1_GOSMU|nr:hypothetical protein E1A91_A04G187300v1 [Gossypium mustelinum]